MIALAFCLTVLNESEESWGKFLTFAIGLGVRLQQPGSTLVSDMDKGLRNACTELQIKPRECLTHIHARLEKMHVFIRGHRESIGPFFKFAKVIPFMFKDCFLKFRLNNLYLHTPLTFPYCSSGHNTGGRRLLARTTPSSRYQTRQSRRIY